MNEPLPLDDPTHPDALHTPGGVVDLRTGEWFPFDEPRRLLTTLVDPAESSDGCDTWLSVLDEVTGGNAHASEVIGRFMGYSLGGHTWEEAILMFLGSGERRSNLLGGWWYAMGGYAEQVLTTLHIMRYKDLFRSAARTNKRMLKTVGNMPTILGGGSDDFIRSATSYEPLEIEQEPQFKLVLTADAFYPSDVFPELDDLLHHRVLAIRTADAAESADIDLAKALMAEAPSILRWLIDRHLEWREHGLLDVEG